MTANDREQEVISVIIPAAGLGKRLNAPVAKQFLNVGGKTILAHTVEKFQQWAADYQHHVEIIVVLSSDAELPDDVCGVRVCTGGKERADSVANALSSLPHVAHVTADSWVMVHDAARPLVRVKDIETLYQALKHDSVGGILAKKIMATVKRAHDNHIAQTIPREDLWLAQTPQMFRFGLLSQSLAGSRTGLTDEASGIEALGLCPKIVAGHRDNVKITTAEDLDYFRQHIHQHIGRIS